MESTKPFFSVGIPTFNRSDLLREAIRGVLSQTDADFELLISDNASADSTQQVVAEFSDKRIQYFRQPNNIGPVNNFNFIIQKAVGTFFVLHQDDDLLHPEFLERCREAVSGQPEVVIFGSNGFNGESPEGIHGVDIGPRQCPWHRGHCFEKFQRMEGMDMAIMLLFSLPIISPGVAFRLDALKKSNGYFQEFEWAADNVTMVKVALQGRVVYDPRPGFFFRIHQGNASFSYAERKQSRFYHQAHAIIMDLLAKHEPSWTEQALKLLARLPVPRCYQYLAAAWENNENPTYRELLAKTIAAKAHRPPAWVQINALMRKSSWRKVVLNRLPGNS